MEIGNCLTVASLAVLLPTTFAFDFSRANLKVGSSLPDEQRVGDVVHEARVAGIGSPVPGQGGGHAGRERRRPRQKISTMILRHGISLLNLDQLPSQLPQERHQVVLLLLRQLQLQDEVEELDGVLQGQTAAVVQVGRAVLDAAQA